jgi:hypothetical protein
VIGNLNLGTEQATNDIVFGQNTEVARFKGGAFGANTNLAMTPGGVKLHLAGTNRISDVPGSANHVDIYTGSSYGPGELYIRPGAGSPLAAFSPNGGLTLKSSSLTTNPPPFGISIAGDLVLHSNSTPRVVVGTNFAHPDSSITTFGKTWQLSGASEHGDEFGKSFRMGVANYSNAFSPGSLIEGSFSSAGPTISYGGGTGAGVPVISHSWYGSPFTGATNPGNLLMRLNESGHWMLNTNVVASGMQAQIHGSVRLTAGLFELGNLGAMKTPNANSARFAAVGSELQGADGNGNIVTLTQHPEDGPELMYDEDPLTTPWFAKTVNVFLGTIEWINVTRQTDLLQRQWDGEDIRALPKSKRTVRVVETFAQYNSRMRLTKDHDKYLEKIDFDLLQNQRQAEYEARRNAATTELRNFVSTRASQLEDAAAQAEKSLDARLAYLQAEMNKGVSNVEQQLTVPPTGLRSGENGNALVNLRQRYQVEADSRAEVIQRAREAKAAELDAQQLLLQKTVDALPPQDVRQPKPRFLKRANL